MTLRRFWFALVFAAAVVSAADTYEVKIENNVAMKTRDGVTLRADVYRPKADGKFPVILERTPYDKRGNVGFGMRAAARGYVYIAQDVRGRNASEGEFYALKYESADGYDAVEWAAALPYSNGKVGMWGGSYVGMTQVLAAVAGPPHLAGIMPVVTASSFYAHGWYQGGAFSQLVAESWSSAMSLDTLQRRVAKSAQALYWDPKQPPSKYPLIELGSTNGLADYYYDFVAHPTYGDYWKTYSIEERYNQIKVPALHVAAWYDLFQDGSLKNYAGIKANGGSEAARNGQRLVIAVGGHAGPGPKVGEVDFGKDSVIDTSALGLRWYDYILKGIDNGMASEKPVRVFVMGKNVWRNEDDWPLARAVPARYYLHSAGRANSLNGDGGLNTSAPNSEPSDKFTYDPADPVPTQGGPQLGDPVHFPPGPLDQRKVEARSDVLVYTAPAFEKDTEVSGSLTLEVYVSSSAVDTDFVGKVMDVSPDGTAINLTDGILRARYRNSMEQPELMTPGKVYKLSINLWSTANVFLAGHKLRLEMESSNFPRFSRNHNTADNPESATTEVKATNVIYHDRDHPSALIVPIVP